MIPADWLVYGAAVVEEINHVKNPQFQNGSDGLADYWEQQAGAAAFTNAQIEPNVQRVQYTGATAGGDWNATIYPLDSNWSAVGTVAPGEVWTGTIDLKGITWGCALSIFLSWMDAGGVLLSSSAPVAVSLTPELADSWRTAVCSDTAPANASIVRMMSQVTGVHSDDVLDLYAKCPTIIKVPAANPIAFFDPSAIGAHWNGAWNASASAKELVYPSVGKFVIEDTANARGPALHSPGRAVTPGRLYTASVLVEVLVCVGGALHCDLGFYTAGDAYIDGYPIHACSAVAAEAEYSLTTGVPATAAYARLDFRWIGSTGNCKATIREACLDELPGGPVLASCPFSFTCEPYAYGPAVTALNQVTILSPLVIDCGTILGDYPTPLTIEFAWDTTALVRDLWCGKLAPGSALTIADLMRDCEGGTWAGGTTGDTSLAGAHTAYFRYNASNTNAGRYFSDQTFDPGTYLTMVRCSTESATDDGWFGLTDSLHVQLLSSFNINHPSPGIRLQSFGRFFLPSAKARGAQVSQLQLGMQLTSAVGAGHAVWTDYICFVPTSWGYFHLIQPNTAGVAQKLRVEGGGAVYQNDVGNFSNFGGAPIVALGPTKLALFTQSRADDDPVHYGIVTVTYTPRYALWR